MLIYANKISTNYKQLLYLWIKLLEMEIINFKHQIVVFGIYDDITPNIDNIKYFIDVFADKNLIPNQIRAVSLNLTGNSVKNSDSTRLSLTSTNGMWNISFLPDRIDFTMANSNIGIIEMPTIDKFITEVEDILNKVSKRFPKQHKRVGLVSQYLIKGLDVKKSSQKAIKTIDFFKEKPMLEWSNKASTRITIQIPEPEFINISNELRWIKTILKAEDKTTVFDGLLLNIDINTLNEKQDYRFNNINLKSLLSNVSRIEEQLKNENIANLSE